LRTVFDDSRGEPVQVVLPMSTVDVTTVDLTGATTDCLDEVVDTGLTMHYLCRSLALRSPASLARYWCRRSGIPWLGRADIGHDIDNKVVPFGRIASGSHAAVRNNKGALIGRA